MKQLLLTATAMSGVALTIALSGCSSASHSSTRDAANSFKLSISVERSTSEDKWTVTYRTNQPVSELVFDRQVNRFRAAHWKTKTPHLEIKEIDEKEVIRSQDGSRFDAATFELASYYEMTPKDYEFFQSFSDKSVVMYTGHYNACPRDQDCEEPVEFHFRGGPSDKIVVLGKVEKAEFRWTDKTQRGTYVYFGNIKPLERKHLTAIIDPALPNWLEKRFHETLPKLFDLYTKETGYPLTFKPFVFLNYSPEGQGTRRHGGTLPGLIQMSLSGKGWAKEDREEFIGLAKFFAHESAHVWNGQLFPYESGDMWMHEGGADAFAYFALYRLGLIDRQGLLDFQSGAYNHCVSELKNRPLKEVKEDRNFRAHYTCGSMIALITHSAVKKRNLAHGLFQFWNALFSKMKSENLRAYSEDTYFTTLQETTGDKELVEKLRAFVNGPTESSTSFLRAELERQGVKFTSLENAPPKTYQMDQARNLVRALMDQDCGNRHSLSIGSAGVETDPVKGCKVFTKNFVITKVGPHPIKNASMAYDFVYNTCNGEDAQIEFMVKDSEIPLKVACPKDLPKREAVYGISSIPL